MKKIFNSTICDFIIINSDILSLSLSLCRLKIQQGLLIDFISFPQKLIDLLELCLAEIQQESPK